MGRVFLLYIDDILGDTGRTLLCQLCISNLRLDNKVPRVQPHSDHVTGGGKIYQEKGTVY